MIVELWAIAGVLVLLLALMATPFGLPGNWIMVGVLAIATFAGRVGPVVLVATLTLALLAEIAEFYVVQKLNVRYGGSRGAFWGAILGGFAGIVIGMPVPVIGSVVAGFVGSFAGAAVVTLAEARGAGHAARVGWGVLVGRMLATAVKTGAGVAILVLGVAALLF